MTISGEDYNCFMKLQETPKILPAHSSHQASTSGSCTTLLASSSDSLIIDSGVFAHMSGTQSLLTRFSKLSRPCYISIADGHACPIVGHGEANPTSSLQLSQVLYVPNFLVNLLSISAITKALFCSISFFPYHHTFQDLWTGKRIGLGHETARGLYGLLLDHLPVGLSCLLSSTNFAL